tara:strand:- start:156 stop:386 length:231 start_codon:yes stop_codon:yes gene_type:complete
MSSEIKKSISLSPRKLQNNMSTASNDIANYVTIPWGKWAWYASESTQKVIQDYYLGAQDPKNNNEIKIIKIRPNKT